MGTSSNALSSQLDDLMGSRRDGGESSKHREETQCKSFLAVGFCHKELFEATRASTGACASYHEPAARCGRRLPIEPKMHSPWRRPGTKKRVLKRAYLASVNYLTKGYEKVVAQELSEIILKTTARARDLKRKVRGLMEYGGETNEERMIAGDEEIELNALEASMDSAVEKANAFAEAGNIDAMERVFTEMDKGKARLVQLHALRSRLRQKQHQRKDFVICELCDVGLSESRINSAEHIEGRVHTGMLKIHEALEELLTRMEKEDKDTKKWAMRYRKKHTVEMKEMNDRQTALDDTLEKHGAEQKAMGSKWRISENGKASLEKKNIVPIIHLDDEPDVQRYQRETNTELSAKKVEERKRKDREARAEDEKRKERRREEDRENNKKRKKDVRDRKRDSSRDRSKRRLSPERRERRSSRERREGKKKDKSPERKSTGAIQPGQIMFNGKPIDSADLSKLLSGNIDAGSKKSSAPYQWSGYEKNPRAASPRENSRSSQPAFSSSKATPAPREPSRPSQPAFSSGQVHVEGRLEFPIWTMANAPKRASPPKRQERDPTPPRGIVPVERERSRPASRRDDDRMQCSPSPPRGFYDNDNGRRNSPPRQRTPSPRYAPPSPTTPSFGPPSDYAGGRGGVPSSYGESPVMRRYDEFEGGGRPSGGGPPFGQPPGQERMNGRPPSFGQPPGPERMNGRPPSFGQPPGPEGIMNRFEEFGRGGGPPGAPPSFGQPPGPEGIMNRFEEFGRGGGPLGAPPSFGQPPEPPMVNRYEEFGGRGGPPGGGPISGQPPGMERMANRYEEFGGGSGPRGGPSPSFLQPPGPERMGNRFEEFGGGPPGGGPSFGLPPGLERMLGGGGSGPSPSFGQPPGSERMANRFEEFGGGPGEGPAFGQPPGPERMFGGGGPPRGPSPSFGQPPGPERMMNRFEEFGGGGGPSFGQPPGPERMGHRFEDFGGGGGGPMGGGGPPFGHPPGPPMDNRYEDFGGRGPGAFLQPPGGPPMNRLEEFGGHPGPFYGDRPNPFPGPPGMMAADMRMREQPGEGYGAPPSSTFDSPLRPQRHDDGRFFFAR